MQASLLLQDYLENNSAAHACLDPITTLLRASHFVQLVGHSRPDGDCIGSLLAMHHVLNALGKPHAMAVQKMKQCGYDGLPGYDLIAPLPQPNQAPDLVVYLDCALRERGIPGYCPDAPIINIDHHPHTTNEHYGQINWVSPECCATGEMVFYLALALKVDLTSEMAEAMLIAIAMDTDWFRTEKAKGRQHRIAACLIEAGADPERVARLTSGGNSPQGMRLMGHILNGIRIECGGRLAWSEVRAAIMRAEGGEAQLPEKISDMVKMIRGVRLGVLYQEIETGIRINLRSTMELDIAGLARQLGGGGHPQAAGVILTTPDYLSARDGAHRKIVDYVLEKTKSI